MQRSTVAIEAAELIIACDNRGRYVGLSTSLPS
jgi:hypothetical protein